MELKKFVPNTEAKRNCEIHPPTPLQALTEGQGEVLQALKRTKELSMAEIKPFCGTGRRPPTERPAL